jgi:RNA polymerase sigma-54 factor
VRYVVPDIRVVRDNDEFIINLNDEAFPVLGINPNFEKFGDSADQAARDFARENIREARLFISHLSQRSQTLIRVANAILEFQRSFFINGPKYLTPLTLSDIARELKVHETTVSRTANGKYMQTDWGIFEIRYFFTNSISGAGSSGSQYSKESVKEIIKEIISGENRLLSDQDISALLSQKGIALARRTVAKYRKELDMGSSYTRKVGK